MNIMLCSILIRAIENIRYSNVFLTGPVKRNQKEYNVLTCREINSWIYESLSAYTSKPKEIENKINNI